MSTTSKKVETITDKATASFNDAGAMLNGYFAAISTASRIALEGTIEVDKLILSKLGEAAKDTASYGKDLMAARDIKTVYSMATDFATSRLNKNVADTKQVLDLAKTRVEDVIEPFKAVHA